MAANLNQTLVLIRGDTRVLTITCTAPASDPTWTLADAPTLRFTAKERVTDADSAAVFAYDLTDGITVTDDLTATITIAGADWPTTTCPGRLVWDLEGRDVSGEPTTLAGGTIVVTGDVTRDAP